MDIDQLYTVEDHEEGAEMQVMGPRGKLLDMFIKVKGMEKKKFYKNQFLKKLKIKLT